MRILLEVGKYEMENIEKLRSYKWDNCDLEKIFKLVFHLDWGLCNKSCKTCWTAMLWKEGKVLCPLCNYDTLKDLASRKEKCE